MNTAKAFREAAPFLSAQRLLLLAINNTRLEGRTHTQLVELTGLKAVAVTMAKNRLWDKGLINEHRPSRDLRSVKLYLTAEGAAEAKKLWKAIDGMSRVKRSHLNSHVED